MTDSGPESGGGVAAPKALWFDGILEGRHAGREGDLRSLVSRLNATRIGTFELETDGARFSLLADDSPVRLDDAETDRTAEFAATLSELVRTADGELESTLRCTELLEGDRVRETLFGVTGDGLKPVSRLRQAGPEDRARFAPPVVEDPPLPIRGKAMIVAVVGLLLIGGLVAWRSGFIDRALAADVDSLAIEEAEFDGLLQVEIGHSLGNYEVTVSRGDGFPSTPAEVEARIAAAETTAERAAVNLVADGEEIFVHLEDEEGLTLAVASASLRKLLNEDGGAVEITIPGHRLARRLRLSLDGEPQWEKR